MKGTKGTLPDSAEPFEITVNGEVVPGVEWSDKRWFQTAPLFKALGFDETNVCIPASKASSIFLDSGEFRPFKHHGSWFGTIAGLSQYSDYLRECQSSRHNPQDREAAGILSRSLMKWLSDVSGAPL